MKKQSLKEKAKTFKIIVPCETFEQANLVQRILQKHGFLGVLEEDAESEREKQ